MSTKWVTLALNNRPHSFFSLPQRERWFHIPLSTFNKADKVSTQLKVKNNLSALPVVNAYGTHTDTIDFK